MHTNHHLYHNHCGTNTILQPEPVLQHLAGSALQPRQQMPLMYIKNPKYGHPESIVSWVEVHHMPTMVPSPCHGVNGDWQL